MPRKITRLEISDLPAAVVLAALYNNQFVYGIGVRTDFDGSLTIRQAQSILTLNGSCVEVLMGRPIYVHFGAWVNGELWFDPTEYDAIRGEGAALAVIEHLNEMLGNDLKSIIADCGERLLV